MMCESCYQQVLNDISELGIWAAPFINIGEAEELTCLEFEFYRKVFKEKYEAENSNKNEIIKMAFEYVGQCTKAICETIGKAFTGK